MKDMDKLEKMKADILKQLVEYKKGDFVNDVINNILNICGVNNETSDGIKLHVPMTEHNSKICIICNKTTSEHL